MNAKILLIYGFLLIICLFIGYVWGEKHQASQDNKQTTVLYKQMESCKSDPSTISCLGISPEMYTVEFNPTDCKESLTTQSNAAQIVWYYRHCPIPTPTIMEQSNSQNNNNVFTCSDPTNGLPAPCRVTNILNGTCEDTSNGEAFPCVNATRIANSYPPPSVRLPSGFDFGKPIGSQ